MYGEKSEKKNVFSKIRPCPWGIIHLGGGLGRKMTVYIDELILVNFILDYLLLWGAGLISGKRLKRWRIALGAVLGGGYALICAVWSLKAVLWLPVRVGVGVAMCFLAYGRRSWRTVGWLFALGGGMAGGVFALSVFGGGRIGFLSGAVYIRFPGWLLCGLAAAVWLGLTALARLPSLGRGRKNDRVCASISCLNRKTETEVFIDTGCFLRDPADNSAVLLISKSLGRELLPKTVVSAFKADLIKGYGQGTERTAKAIHAGGHQGRTDTVFP